MHTIWLKLRLPLTIVCVLVMTLALARLFSGPEDAWIRNEQGEWVKHGHPSGPQPADDYREPARHLILPLRVLAGFAVPLFFFGFHKPKNRLTYEIAKRDMHVTGYLSIALPLMGVLIVTGLAVELALSGPDSGIPPREQVLNALFVVSLIGFSGLCILLGAVCYMLKRTINVWNGRGIE